MWAYMGPYGPNMGSVRALSECETILQSCMFSWNVCFFFQKLNLCASGMALMSEDFIWEDPCQMIPNAVQSQSNGAMATQHVCFLKNECANHPGLSPGLSQADKSVLKRTLVFLQAVSFISNILADMFASFHPRQVVTTESHGL